MGSCTVTATQKCFSSRLRHLRHSSDQRLPMPCLILLGTWQLKVAILRILASPSMVAKDGQMSSLRTTIAMGNYYFTCAESGSISKVEYTFGYKKTKDGKLRIFL